MTVMSNPSVGTAGPMTPLVSEERFATLVAAEGAQPNPGLAAALDACARFDGGSYFQNRRENRVALFVVAYALLLELIRGGEEAVTLAIQRFPPGQRQRAPSRDKRELIALQLAAKPETEAQRKLCSDYASVLMVALARGLSAQQFVQWVGEATVDECKFQATKIRAVLKAKVPAKLDEEPAPAAAPQKPDAATPSEPSQKPHLEIRLIGNTGVLGTLTLAVPDRAFSRLAEFISGNHDPDSAEDVLSTLARLIRTAVPPHEAPDCIPF
jgi:hypothetical protein